MPVVGRLVPRDQPNWAPERVRRNFRLDLFAGICAGIYASAVWAFLPVVVRRMGGTEGDVAIVVAAPFIGHLASPVLAYALAGVPRVRLIAGTVIAARLVFAVGAIVATTPFLLGLLSVVTWIITLANIAAYTSLMAAIYPPVERAQAMGNVRIGVSIAGIAAAAVTGALIDVVPVVWVFVAATVVSLPGALGFGLIRDESARRADERRPATHVASDLWADARYRRLLLASLTFGFGNLMNFAVYPILLVDRYDTPNSFVGILVAAQSATSIVGYLLFARVIDRGSALRVTPWNAAGALLVPLGYLIAPSYWWLIPVAIVVGASVAVGDLTYHLNVVQLAPPGRVAEYAAAQSFALGVRGTVAPFVAAALLGALEPRLVLGIGLGFMAIGTAQFALLGRSVAQAAVARAASPPASAEARPRR